MSSSAAMFTPKEKCQKCFARFYCSGGCAANSYNFHGSINDAYDIGCELQRKRVECAIMIKAATGGVKKKENKVMKKNKAIAVADRHGPVPGTSDLYRSNWVRSYGHRFRKEH